MEKLSPFNALLLAAVQTERGIIEIEIFRNVLRVMAEMPEAQLRTVIHELYFVADGDEA